MAIELLQALAQHANCLKMIHKYISQCAEHCRCVAHRDCRFKAAAEDETKMMQCSTIMVNRLLELDTLLRKRTHHHLA